MLQDLVLRCSVPSKDNKNQRAPLSSVTRPRSWMPCLGREEAPLTAASMEREEAGERVKQTRVTEQGILPSDSHPCVVVHSLTLVHCYHSSADTGRRRASLSTSRGQHGSGLGTWSSVRVANRTQYSGERAA